MVAFHYSSIIPTVVLPTTEIIEPFIPFCVYTTYFTLPNNLVLSYILEIFNNHRKGF
ncbi:protein of unknown function [Streptococcus thermophilus]|uniref:Uncharacterized protein n=1 Tax=Streptococcus thermophilus TaxID=1308 RepID=A0AAU9H7E3_STRTR|nr:protein of unknown function [Streptococcus thermophilus]CAD0169767.1 protein of unknown function [Streptococcus thermophilus]